MAIGTAHHDDQTPTPKAPILAYSYLRTAELSMHRRKRGAVFLTRLAKHTRSAPSWGNIDQNPMTRNTAYLILVIKSSNNAIRSERSRQSAATWVHRQKQVHGKLTWPPFLADKTQAFSSLPWIFLVGEFVELDVVEATVRLFDLANVDRLHDVASFGVNHHGAPRARDFHPLERGHQFVAIG
jgi:hypothetical protein